MEIPSFYFLYTFFPLESCSEYLSYARFHVALESCEWDSIISASGSLNSQCMSYQRQQYFIRFSLQIVCNILIKKKDLN